MKLYLIWIKSTYIIWNIAKVTDAQGVTLSGNGTSTSGATVVQGSALALTCTSSQSAVSITWWRKEISASQFNRLFDMARLPTGNCVYEGNIPSGVTFSCISARVYTCTIGTIQSDGHGDTWRCEGDINNALYASNTVQISVLVPISKLEMSPNVDPVSLIVNQTAHFTCTSNFGRPTPSIYWFKENATNDDFDDINITHLSMITTVSENITISTLGFTPSKADHNMRLYCSGNNGASPVSSVTKPLINILSGPTKPTLFYSGSIVAESIDATSGDAFIITCRSSGNPPPVYTWTYPWGTATGENLMIRNISLQQEGNYTCSASNTMTPSIGLVRSETNHVSILVKVNVPITQVTMVSPPSNTVLLKENDSTTFECETSSGKPVAVIKWHKDNRTPYNVLDDMEMTNASVTLLPTNATRSVLRYTPTRSDNDMKIYCTGNNIGETLTSDQHAKLIIASFPDTPSSVAVSDVTYTSVGVSWHYRSADHMFQRFIIEIKEEDDEWIERSVLAALLNLSSSGMYSELTMLKQYTDYRIRMYAENALGRSGPSSIVSFTTSSVAESGTDLPSTSGQSSNVGAISGGVVGGVVFGILLGILGTWFVVIRRKGSILQGCLSVDTTDISHESQNRTEYLAGSDEAYSSIPPNPGDRNKRDDHFQRVQGQKYVREIESHAGTTYENMNVQKQEEGDTNAKHETQLKQLPPVAMYEFLTPDAQGREEYEMIKTSNK